MQRRQQVFHVQDADDLVRGAFVDRNSAEPRCDNGGPDVRPGIFLAEGADVCARRHDLLGIFGPKIHNALKDALLFFASFLVVGQFEGLLQVFHAHFGGGRLKFGIHPTS